MYRCFGGTGATKIPGEGLKLLTGLPNLGGGLSPSLHHMDPRDQTQAIRLGRQQGPLLSEPAMLDSRHLPTLQNQLGSCLEIPIG